MTTTIDYTYFEDGENLSTFTLTTEEETWTGLLEEFAVMLTRQPEDFRFYINTDILKKHLEAAHREMVASNFNKSVDTE